MNILITGGAGFIGSHLAENLLKDGHNISIIDNLSTGSLSNIDAIKHHEKFDIKIASILDEATMTELVSSADCIYHLAAVVGVKNIMLKPVETLETNVKGTETVLRLANKFKKKILITSTSEVYGKNECPVNEDSDRIMGPTNKRRWAYACSKALDEFEALAYFDEKKLPVVITRLFNTVGPRQTGRYGMVLPNFVQRALMGRPITVYGTGEQTRCFTHVLDVVDAVTALMEEPKAEGQIFNVGNNEEISIKNLALLVKEMTGSHSELEFIPYEKAYGPGFEDMDRRCPNIDKIEKYIGFRPRHDLRSIIQSVIEYFKQ